MDRIELQDATAEQLRRFGATILGIEVSGRENREKMLAKFAEVNYGLGFITLPDEAPVPTGGPRADNAAFNRRTNPDTGKEEVLILLHTEDKPGGDRAVAVGVNGSQMLIPRGEKVWVPEAYVEVLNNAEEYHYPEYDDGLGGLKKPRVVKSYPFSFA